MSDHELPPTLNGGCACGRVRYEVSATPTARTNCHCEQCRRASGAPFVAWFTVPSAALQFTRGKPTRHKSSERGERGFCDSCGTQLTFRLMATPEAVDVTTCSLDDPAPAAPRDHTFFGSRLPWIEPGDDLPKYPRARG